MQPVLRGSEEATTALAACQKPNRAGSCLWRGDAALGDTDEQRKSSWSYLSNNEKQELNQEEKLLKNGTMCPWDGPYGKRWCWDCTWTCNRPGRFLDKILFLW